MNWEEIGKRIRKQREFLGFTRENFAEKIDVTPKFCCDIELGLKGMSVPTLCKISNTLKLSLDYIIFGEKQVSDITPIIDMINNCPPDKCKYLEQIIKTYMFAINDEER